MIVEKTATVRASPEEVYRFHLSPENLLRIMPPEIGLRVANGEGQAEEGSEVRMSVVLMGQRTEFVSRYMGIAKNGIVDELLDGPMRWRHTHSFFPSVGGTVIRERVEYSVQPRLIGYLAERLIVGKVVEWILDYRMAMLLEIFGSSEGARTRVNHDPLTFSLLSGNLIQIFGAATVPLTLSFLGSNIIFNLILMLLGWVTLWYFTHGISHYVAGRLLGIRFNRYFLGISNIIRLRLLPFKKISYFIITIGIMTEKSSMRRASGRRRAIMFAAGALGSMVFPFVVPLYATLIRLSFEALILYLVSLGNLLFTAYFSWKVGDLKKAKDALAARRRSDPDTPIRST